jgi:sn-glycerol 3-phosphate transport system permease protein
VAGAAKVRHRRWTARNRRDFFVFLAMALPNLVLIAVFTTVR